MKRAAMLYCADCLAPRYKVLNQREQLPFASGYDGFDGKWADFTLDDAFRLRLMLDLVGGESSDETQLNGLGPTYSSSIVANAMSLFPYHPLNQTAQNDLWAGLVVFQEEDSEGVLTRFSDWYIGDLGALGTWVATKQTRSYEEIDGANITEQLSVVRIFLANATRAAKFTRMRAHELGLQEGLDSWEARF